MTETNRSRFMPAVLLLLFIALRFIFPTADPAPFKDTDVSWHDEGWVHNARNKALFGKWQLDEFNPMFVSPVFTFLEFLSFRVFGVNTFSARFVSMLLGSLSLLALCLFAKDAYGPKIALISLIFIGSNYLYLMFNRVAMLETTMIFFMILSLWLFQKGRRRIIYLFLSGCCLTLAYFSKASALFLMAALPSFLIFRVYLNRNDRLNRKRCALEFCIFLTGVLLSLALWAVFWIIPHLSEYLKYNINLYARRSAPQAIANVLLQLGSFSSVNNFFIRAPVVSFFGGLSLLEIIYSLIRKKAVEADILMFCLISTGFLQVMLSGAYARRMLFFIPFMAILAAKAVASPSLNVFYEKMDKKNYLGRIILLLTGFYLTYGICMAVIYSITPLKQNRILASFLLSIPFFLVLIIKKSAATGLLKHLVSKRAAYLLVILSLLVDGGQFCAWATNKGYEVINASRKIGTILPEKTKVQGGLALALSLENKIMPFLIADGYGNFSDMLIRDDIKYIVTSNEPYLGSENKTMQKLAGYYQRSKVIHTFNLQKAGGESLSVVLLEKSR